LPKNFAGWESQTIEALKARVNDDEALVRRGRYLTTTFLLEVGEAASLISIFEGRIVSVTSGPNGKNSGAAGRRPARTI
jgi:hypothetical protein